MLATPELIREAAQIPKLEELLPRWRSVPLYRNSLARVKCKRPDFECFKRLPLLAKPEMRSGFPQNFLPDGLSLDALLEKNLVELEHTSGTSEERLPVIFGLGWWNEQEERALRLNDFVAAVLDEHPNARRATLVPPACNGLTCPTVWMSREQRTVGNTLFVNLARIPFLLEDRELARMAGEIFGMVAAVSRRGPGSRRALRAFLRAARNTIPVGKVHFVQLRICQRGASPDS